jgi:hypothetical protein
MTTIIFCHLHGIDLSDFGILEQEKPPKDSLKMVTLKKFFHVLFHQMEDISFLQELINKSNFGMLKVTVNTLLKNTITTIGFLKLDLFPPQLKHQLVANFSPQSDGMEILRSGTTKLSTLRIALKFMMEVSMLLQFLLEEISL